MPNLAILLLLITTVVAVADETLPFETAWRGAAPVPAATGEPVSLGLGYVSSGYASVNLKTGFSLAGVVTDAATHVSLKTDYATLRLPKSNIESIHTLSGPSHAATTPDISSDSLVSAIPSGSDDDPELRSWNETIPVAVRASFLKKVQPILLTRCGAADCHGSEATNDFRLVSPRQHINAAILNLKASLHQLDLIDPLESPLVAKPRTTHGKVAPLFTRAQQPQLNALVQWADNAVAEVPKGIFDGLVLEALTKPVVQPHLVSQSDVVTSLTSESPVAVRDVPHPPRFEARFDARDPFDPSIFNMMHHSNSINKSLNPRTPRR